MVSIERTELLSLAGRRGDVCELGVIGIIPIVVVAIIGVTVTVPA
jgi:hypothetical protein